MKNKKEFKKYIKEIVLKNRFELTVIGIVGAFFCFGVPLIIDLVYAFGQSHVLFITTWDSADMLSYYGTLLGAVATIIAVVSTIIYSRETSMEERKHAEKQSRIDSSIIVCFDLIESCQFAIIMEKLEILPDKSGWDVLSMTDRNIEKKSRELFILANKIRISKKKLEFYYMVQLNNNFKSLTEYFDEYIDRLEHIANYFNPDNEEYNLNIGHDQLEELQIFYKNNNDQIIQMLYEMVHYLNEEETAKEIKNSGHGDKEEL